MENKELLIMGLAASQMRFLALTAKKSNSEYQGQQINQQRLNLANDSSSVYNAMANASVPIPPDAGTVTENGTNYSITYRGTTYTSANSDDVFTQAYNAYITAETAYRSQLATLEAKSEEIQQMDKKLELQLKRIDTEHSAIKTEIDAVKKILDDNVEASFKTFA